MLWKHFSHLIPSYHILSPKLPKVSQWEKIEDKKIKRKGTRAIWDTHSLAPCMSYLLPDLANLLPWKHTNPPAAAGPHAKTTLLSGPHTGESRAGWRGLPQTLRRISRYLKMMFIACHDRYWMVLDTVGFSWIVCFPITYALASNMSSPWSILFKQNPIWM